MFKKKIFSVEYVPDIWQGASRVRYADVNEQVKIFMAGIDNGLNAIDTAESYSDGQSEIIIGKLLENISRHKIFISDKVSPQNAKSKDIHKSIDGSLKRLGTDYIDLYQLHWNNPLVPAEEVISTFLDLQKSGKIRYIGVSNFTLPNIQKYFNLLNGKLAVVQMEYNLINRTAENDIIPLCQKNNIIFSAWGPLTQGDFNFDTTTIEVIAKKYNKTIHQIILNWIIKTNNVVAITKSSNINHIFDNLDATNLFLHNDDYNLINESYKTNIIKIKPNEIECLSTGGNEEGNHPAYKTIDEAIENRFNFYPSPEILSKELLETKVLPYPVYVKNINDKFKLVGGNTRYWAWVIAFGFENDINCILLKNKEK